MRLISNEESDVVSGGMAIAIIGVPAAVAAVEQIEGWASGWGFDFSSFVNESDGSYGSSGEGTVSANTENGALELFNSIKKSIGVDGRVSGKIHADSKGGWTVDIEFEIGGQILSSKSKGK